MIGYNNDLRVKLNTCIVAWEDPLSIFIIIIVVAL